MTVDPQDHDPSLEGHPAVERNGVLHALARRYPGDSERAETECGIAMAAWSGVTFRGEYDEDSFCVECWPQEIRP
jgi:hypothetical protein